MSVQVCTFAMHESSREMRTSQMTSPGYIWEGHSSIFHHNNQGKSPKSPPVEAFLSWLLWEVAEAHFCTELPLRVRLESLFFWVSLE